MFFIFYKNYINIVNIIYKTLYIHIAFISFTLSQPWNFTVISGVGQMENFIQYDQSHGLVGLRRPHWGSWRIADWSCWQMGDVPRVGKMVSHVLSSLKLAACVAQSSHHQW